MEIGKRCRKMYNVTTAHDTLKEIFKGKVKGRSANSTSSSGDDQNKWKTIWGSRNLGYIVNLIEAHIRYAVTNN